METRLGEILSLGMPARCCLLARAEAGTSLKVDS